MVALAVASIVYSAALLLLSMCPFTAIDDSRCFHCVFSLRYLRHMAWTQTRFRFPNMSVSVTLALAVQYQNLDALVGMTPPFLPLRTSPPSSVSSSCPKK